MHISKKDAEAEAIRLAWAFLATQWSAADQARHTLLSVRPDRFATNYRDRKTIIKYVVVFRLDPADSGFVDGGEAMILVNIKDQFAEWWS